ncbi:hypothetical protein OG21DRAFT_1514562 [Imleria badia]|nr:hypothetical protein OG21DRAFT_1514562 [Imleria badia]
MSRPILQWLIWLGHHKASASPKYDSCIVDQSVNAPAAQLFSPCPLGQLQLSSHRLFQGARKPSSRYWRTHSSYSEPSICSSDHDDALSFGRNSSINVTEEKGHTKGTATTSAAIVAF